jgi:5'-methylthioadenosine phosphorylase
MVHGQAVAKRETIGVIGGSGLYEIAGLTSVRRVAIDTPFGAPSDDYLVGDLGETELVFLPRHGRRHRLAPSEINFRANIHGMKQLGVTQLLSVSAVGSMKEAIRPGDLVVVDQFFDRTSGRASSFFGDGVVGHIPFADPICPALHARVLGATRAAAEAAGTGARVHERGTYLVINGPQFSTRAESKIFRSWGVDVIGKTNLPEALLDREAGLCSATVALATDYDCWHESEEDVSVAQVLAVLRQNVATARDVIVRTARAAAPAATCACADAIRHAVITDASAIPAAAAARLALILGTSPSKDSRTS